MRLTVANNEAKKYACLHYHYAKRLPVGSIGFNVYNDDDEWCGCILYAKGASPHIACPYGLGQGQVLELVRVALNGKQGNGRTSQAVSMSLKMLKQTCPLVRLVVSFADCDQNHLGTIYQATNWIYTGVSDNAPPQYIVHGKPTHNKTLKDRLSRLHDVPFNIENLRKYIDPNARILQTGGKRKYLYPLDKKMRKQIEHLAQPYPKTDANWHKVDRSQFRHEEEKPEETEEVKENDG